MQRSTFAALRLAMLCMTASTTGACAAQAADPSPTAFVHVNVVPMDRDRVLRDQTVLVEGGVVTAVAAGLPAPAGYRVVDGRGAAYLSPGLADMHTHAETRNDLAVYLANGVTTVLHMGGARPGFVDTTVRRANDGEIAAPHVYAAFLVDGTPEYNGFVITTPAQARAIVGMAKTNGYDFMKVYVGLAPDVFAALADEGRRANMPLVGHGVIAVRLESQLAQGQVMVAHAEEFFYTFFTPAGVEESDVPPDVARIPEAVALALRYGATVTADLVTYGAIARQIGHPEVLAAFLARPDIAYLSPNDRLAWRTSDYGRKTARLERKLDFLRSMVHAMADANVPLIAGTDAPGVPGVQPGFAVHEELDALRQAGLSPFQALSTATREPGVFIARNKAGVPFGEVSPGYRADLILSAVDPLEDLRTLREPLGVMAAGRWHDRPSLASLLERVRAGYRDPP